MGLLNSVLLQAKTGSWDSSSCIMMSEKKISSVIGLKYYIYMNKMACFKILKLRGRGVGIFLSLACILKTRPQVIWK